MTLNEILPDEGYKVTSGPDRRYNCIAWAAGKADRWWEPDPYNYYYWPEAALRDYSLIGWASAFAAIGFRETDSTDHERGFEKVAIYARGEAPTHVARQLANGSWVSKLGQREDIVHDLRALSPLYGMVCHVMKRPIDS